jgi:hypothetical protein
MTDIQKITDIAGVCHEANREWSRITGDTNHESWNLAPFTVRNSLIAGVSFLLANPDCKDDTLHNEWMKYKIAEGWTYGAVKDFDKKEHPCLVPFDQLPKHQQVKDALVAAIVRVLA